MAENYKLPGSSYEEFVKIVKAYATGKVGVPMSLDAVAQTAGMDKTIVSRNNGFLVQLGLISDGNKKSPTQEGYDLGRAYSYKMDEQVIRTWRNIIESDEFLSRMLSAIRIRNGMEKTSFINHILYSSGSSNNNNTRAGASTIIEVYKVAKLVEENDGKIVAVDFVEDQGNDIQQNNIADHSENDQRIIAAVTMPITPNMQGTSVTININITASVDELDALSEKVKTLIESLQK